jgi:hypothetical protein
MGKGLASNMVLSPTKIVSVSLISFLLHLSAHHNRKRRARALAAVIKFHISLPDNDL